MALHIKCVSVHHNDYTLHAILSLARGNKGIGIRVIVSKQLDRARTKEHVLGRGELNFAGEIMAFKSETEDKDAFSDRDRDLLEKAIAEAIGPV